MKQRTYGGAGEGPQASARAALQLALSVQLRLLAPVLSFVTEEVWSWWQAGSVHRAPWPTTDELAAALDGADPGVLDVAAAVLGEVRRAKTEAKRSLRTPVTLAEVHADAGRLAQLAAVEGDVTAAGVVGALRTSETGSAADPLSVMVELAPDDA